MIQMWGEALVLISFLLHFPLIRDRRNQEMFFFRMWVSYISASVNMQYNLVPVVGQRCSATGKVTVGLASTGHASQTLVVYPPRAQDLSKGDRHPTNTLRGVWYSVPIYVGPNSINTVKSDRAELPTIFSSLSPPLSLIHI